MASSKALPTEMAERVRSLIEEEIKARYTTSTGKTWSERQIADAFGLTQPQLNAIRNSKATPGVHALLALRNYFGMSIDAILGLPPVAPRVAEQAQPAADWPRRRMAEGIARAKGIPEHVIQAVGRRHSDPKFRSSTVIWWSKEFEEAYLAELDAQGQVRAATDAKKPQKREATPRKRAAG